MQLDVRERGFAYAEDAPLDMRMDDTDGPDGRRRAQRVPRRGARPRSCTQYGEERFARRIAEAVVRERDRGAVHPVRPARRAALRRDPGAGPAHRRAPGQAHLPGAAHRGQRRAVGAAAGAARPPSTRSASAAAWWSCPTTRWRTGSPSRCSPSATRSDVPPDLPFVPEGHEPALRLVTRGAEKASRGRRSRHNHAPHRSACAPSSGSGQGAVA